MVSMMKSNGVNMFNKIRDWLCAIVYVISIIIGFYVSIWVMLIEPIIMLASVLMLAL